MKWTENPNWMSATAKSLKINPATMTPSTPANPASLRWRKVQTHAAAAQRLPFLANRRRRQPATPLAKCSKKNRTDAASHGPVKRNRVLPLRKSAQNATKSQLKTTNVNAANLRA